MKPAPARAFVLFLFFSILSSQSADYAYITNNNTITILSYAGPAGPVQIPNSIDGLPVTTISDSAFSYSGGRGVTSVTIPDSVTTISNRAFYGSRLLTNVIIGAGLTNLSSTAFNSCSNLLTFAVDPQNATYSALDGVLFDKTQKTLVQFPGGRSGTYTLPAGVLSIGDDAFAYCKKINTVAFSDALATIGRYSFYQCTNLSNPVFPASLTNIGERAFGSCYFTELTIGPSISDVGPYAFSICPRLTTVTLSPSVILLERGAFASCGSLSNIVFPNSLTQIGPGAFANCNKLTAVHLPSSATNVASAAFSNCQRLTAISVDPLNPTLTSIDGVLFTKTGELLTYPIGKTASSYTTPEFTTTIAPYAFNHCLALTSIAFSDGVTAIGDFAFEHADNLTNVTLSPNLKSIGQNAFADCWQIPAIQFPNGFLSVGDMAFWSCNALKSLVFPDSVTSIGYESFFGCDNITNVVIGSGATKIERPFDSSKLAAISISPLNPAYISKDGVLMTRDETAIISFPRARAGSFQIPNTVTNLPFAYCTGLTSVNIPSAITRIPADVEAFMQCTSLSNVFVSATVTNIDSFAFYYCTNLQTIYFAGNAPTFGHEIFWSNEIATVYYLPDTTGWESTFGGRPTTLWDPVVNTSDPDFGIRENKFSFKITGSSALSLIVEAANDLSNPTWTPLTSATLTQGAYHFTDPQWTDHPSRIYRLRSP